MRLLSFLLFFWTLYFDSEWQLDCYPIYLEAVYAWDVVGKGFEEDKGLYSVTYY